MHDSMVVSVPRDKGERDKVPCPGGTMPCERLRFEDLAEQVLAGDIERGVGAVVGQILNGARACVRDGLAAREQEELVARLKGR